MDLIDRYKKWRLTHSNESDSESESDSDQQNNSDDSDWNMTVKGSIGMTPYIEQMNDNEQPLDNFNPKIEVVHNNVNQQVESVVQQQLSALSISQNSLSQQQQINGGSIDSPSSRSNPVKSDQIQSTIVSDYRQNSRTSPSKEQNSKLVKELVETQQQRRSSSPQKSSSHSKESPTRSLAHSGGVAKSDLNIVSLELFNRLAIIRGSHFRTGQFYVWVFLEIENSVFKGEPMFDLIFS